MSKLPDYDFGRQVVQDQLDFKDDVRDMLNNGKYQIQSGTAVPTYNANPGELYIRVNSTSVVLYTCYSANTWTLLVSV